MNNFVKVLLINGVETYINLDSIMRIDNLNDHLEVYLTDDTIMNIDKKCLNKFFALKKQK